MADLAKTQANWTRFLGLELGLILSMSRELRELRDKFSLQREQAFTLMDAIPLADYLDVADGYSLSGVKVNVNTAVGGKLYVRITGSGPYTVSVYKATGASGLVAQGSAAAGNTVTLAEQNSSGMSGTWELPGSVTTTTDDTLVIFPVVDYKLRARRVFDGTYPRDASTYAAFIAAIDAVARNLNAALVNIRGLAARWGSEPGLSGVEFMARAFPEGLLADTEKRGLSGEVSRRRLGMLPELAEAMADDTNAGEQDIVKRIVSAGAGSFPSANTGSGSVASHTPGEQCPAGVWTFVCVEGADGDAGGRERFDGSVKIADTDEVLSFAGPQVGQPFSGPRGFGPITILHTYSKTGDGSNDYFVAATSAVVTGDRGRANTDNGTLHWSLVANGGSWDVEFYKSSYRTPGDLVAKATLVASGAAFVASPKNGSGVTVAWQLGGSEGAAEGTLVLGYFVTENGDRVPDKFTVITTVAANPGLMQETMSEELGFPLNSDTSGSETISDGYMIAGTFPPMAQQDN